MRKIRDIFVLSICVPILAGPSIGQTQEINLADAIEFECGLPPRIDYLRAYKQELFDDQIIGSIKKCAIGYAELEVYKWDLADAEFQGCLISEYGYEKEYVSSLAVVYRNLERTRDVVSQIEPYNNCANNMRICGDPVCKKKPQ